MVAEFLKINESLGVQCAIFRQSRLIVKFLLMSSCIIAKKKNDSKAQMVSLA